jgi:hypothetical protein
MSDDPPQAGHNLPKLADLLSEETMKALIEAETEGLLLRDRALVDSCVRFLDAFPKIEDEEGEAKATEVLATIQKFVSKSGRVETARVAFKRPVLEAETSIDQAFRTIGDRLKTRPVGQRRHPYTYAEMIGLRVVEYKSEVNRKLLAEQEAEFNRLAAEATKKERAADRGRGSHQDAADAAARAEKAHDAVVAPPAARTRTHGSDFGTTSLAKKRVFDVITPSAVPREYCVPSDSLIRAAVGKAGDRMPIIPGVSIRDEDDLTVRR